jgi:Glycosyl transferase family 2/Methyltransferase domain
VSEPDEVAFFEQMRSCRDSYRKLAECIHQIIGEQPSCLDIGCGVGLQTARLMELGWRGTVGAEYSAVARQMREPGVTMVAFDLTKIPHGAQKHACVICTETAEHIPAEFADTIAASVISHARDVIVWSAAAPGQEWEGHVNLQPASYWLEKFTELGWTTDIARTGALRDLMRQTHAQHWMASENFHVLVPTPKYSPLHFSITSTTLNAERYVARSIQSVQRQTYPHWDHYVVDAKSNDFTVRAARSQAKLTKNPASRTLVSVNKRRQAALENCWEIWATLPPEEVIVWLDGDDWLGTDHALDILARTYASPAEPWLTYGQFMMATGEVGFASPYHPGENPRHTHWRATHLKTFRAGLVQQMEVSDLMKPDGSWCDLAIDKAVMYPLLDMAGDKHAFIHQILYVYNAKASWWASQPESERQKELNEVYRMQSLPPYPRLPSRPW